MRSLYYIEKYDNRTKYGLNENILNELLRLYGKWNNIHGRL